MSFKLWNILKFIAHGHIFERLRYMQVMGHYWMKWVQPRLCRPLTCPVCWVILPWWCSAAGSTVDAMLQSTRIDYLVRNDLLLLYLCFRNRWRPSSTVQVCYALITLIVVPSITPSTLIIPSFNDARDPVDAGRATECLLISSNISTLCKYMTNFTKSTVSTLQEAVTKQS